MKNKIDKLQEKIQQAHLGGGQARIDSQHKKGTVSYTHLDVYKRQPPTIPVIKPANKGAPDANAIPKHKGNATKKTTILDGISSVSYTHLDVYKRQIP